MKNLFFMLGLFLSFLSATHANDQKVINQYLSLTPSGHGEILRLALQNIKISSPGSQPVSTKWKSPSADQLLHQKGGHKLLVAYFRDIAPMYSTSHVKKVFLSKTPFSIHFTPDKDTTRHPVPVSGTRTYQSTFKFLAQESDKTESAFALDLQYQRYMPLTALVASLREMGLKVDVSQLAYLPPLSQLDLEGDFSHLNRVEELIYGSSQTLPNTTRPSPPVSDSELKGKIGFIIKGCHKLSGHYKNSDPGAGHCYKLGLKLAIEGKSDATIIRKMCDEAVFDFNKESCLDAALTLISNSYP